MTVGIGRRDGKLRSKSSDGSCLWNSRLEGRVGRCGRDDARRAWRGKGEGAKDGWRGGVILRGSGNEREDVGCFESFGISGKERGRIGLPEG
jgi:hypothetical protein